MTISQYEADETVELVSVQETLDGTLVVVIDNPPTDETGT